MHSSFFLFAQNDTLSKYGTIKISKKKDSMYIKAIVHFDVFEYSDNNNIKNYQDFKEKTKNLSLLRSNDVIEPFPVVMGYNIPFDYTAYFNKRINKNMIDLNDKETDTVRIEVCVTAKGKMFYKDLAKLQKIGNQAVIYDQESQAYAAEKNHTNSAFALKMIKKWEPGYRIVTVKDTFKRTIIIKPKKQYLHSKGLITIIFSSTPMIE